MPNSVEVPDPLDKVLAFLNSAANRLYDAQNIAAWNKLPVDVQIRISNVRQSVEALKEELS